VHFFGFLGYIHPQIARMPPLDRALQEAFGTAHRIDCPVCGLFGTAYNCCFDIIPLVRDEGLQVAL
jgi:hypothetical protein